ncbi:hypothetical protein [Oceanirhabdus sp. W0125-5]|uniref:hypothetical protein n=1 Tax=Oceanirhabdus sp. W0125-5 TaxID=2999116 RepID=UPI0022F2C32D|nr:hypothetical protein [Oceanirhabdus sp. W0125-5]WBW98605.1 hypothetical protein OW730_07570 [Oceanirhabdus sp. W0125-5]
MSKLEIIICVLLLNFIIALVYLLFKLLKKDLNGGIIMCNFMIICPVVGPLYLFFSWFIYEIYFKRRDSDINLEELSLSKERIKMILKPDMRKALNKVSLEDVLIVSDKKSARELLLDVVREDSNSSAKAILKAVEHKDSEVSHYAASAISDIINEFKANEKQLRNEYLKDKENSELCNKYIDYLNNFLSQKILSSAEQRFYSRLFEELVITMEEYLPLELSGELYNKLVCILLDIGENDRANVWVEKALKENENELESYKAALRYYYMNEDRSEFLLLMDKLKKSDVVLDHEMLEKVRFFSH